MSKEETMVERSMLQRCVNRMAGADVDLGSFVGQSYVALVVAVIDELAEPTPEMTQAALRVPEVKDVDWVNALFGTGISSYQQIFEASYRAMLSKAKEGAGE